MWAGAVRPKTAKKKQKKLSVTDGWTDRQTDRRTDRQSGGVESCSTRLKRKEKDGF